MATRQASRFRTCLLLVVLALQGCCGSLWPADGPRRLLTAEDPVSSSSSSHGGAADEDSAGSPFDDGGSPPPLGNLDVARAHHGRRFGASKMPTQGFARALASAAVSLQVRTPPPRYGDGARDGDGATTRTAKFVMISMADERIMSATGHLFLEHLHAIKLQNDEDGAGSNAGGLKYLHGPEEGARSLSSTLVLMMWSHAATTNCNALQPQFGHGCVYDKDHIILPGGWEYKADNWHSSGFPRVKYIVNSLSLGYDTLFLDVDQLVFKNLLPYFYGLGADLAAGTDYCAVVDDELPMSVEGGQQRVKVNIGTMFLKAVPQTVRCATSWFSAMWHEITERGAGHAWDQATFDEVVNDACIPRLGLRFHLIDPRYFYMGCYYGCGCAFEDPSNGTATSEAERSWKINFTDGVNHDGICSRKVVEGWYVAHFACGGGLGNGKEDSMIKAARWMKALDELPE